MSEAELPVYKYFTLNQNFYNTIINQTLWFSKAKDFNDPFDCNFVIDEKPSYEDFLAYCCEFEVIEKEQDKDFLKLLYESGEFRSIIEDQANKVLEIKDQGGLCCFTGSCTNLLMWSHYANSHKGVCLKFDYKILKESFISIYPVTYQLDYPCLNIFKDFWKAIHDLHTIKSIDWAYEKEIRIIEERSGLFNFKPEALKAVIFGAKTSEEERLTIMKLLRNSGYSTVKFVRTTLSREKFGLDMEITELVYNGKII
jgi:hypothetical protein